MVKNNSKTEMTSEQFAAYKKKEADIIGLFYLLGKPQKEKVLKVFVNMMKAETHKAESNFDTNLGTDEKEKPEKPISWRSNPDYSNLKILVKTKKSGHPADISAGDFSDWANTGSHVQNAINRALAKVPKVEVRDIVVAVDLLDHGSPWTFLTGCEALFQDAGYVPRPMSKDANKARQLARAATARLAGAAD